MILLIDDDDAVRSSMARLLQRAGYVVRTAANGREGLAVLEQHHPAVVFCDLEMPELDGRAFRHYQLASRRLREIPFVLVSGAITAEEDGQALAAAATLRKPVDAKALVACAQQYDVSRPTRPSGASAQGDAQPHESDTLDT